MSYSTEEFAAWNVHILRIVRLRPQIDAGVPVIWNTHPATISSMLTITPTSVATKGMIFFSQKTTRTSLTWLSARYIGMPPPHEADEVTMRCLVTIPSKSNKKSENSSHNKQRLLELQMTELEAQEPSNIKENL